MIKAVEPKVPFVVEVQENGSSTWLPNGMHFATADEAYRWGSDLFVRWLGIQAYRVVDTRTGEVVEHLPA